MAYDNGACINSIDDVDPEKQRYYDWQATFSRQTGSQGEICIVVGAKGTGKIFGLRKIGAYGEAQQQEYQGQD